MALSNSDSGQTPNTTREQPVWTSNQIYHAASFSSYTTTPRQNNIQNEIQCENRNPNINISRGWTNEKDSTDLLAVRNPHEESSAQNIEVITASSNDPGKSILETRNYYDNIGLNYEHHVSSQFPESPAAGKQTQQKQDESYTARANRSINTLAEELQERFVHIPVNNPSIALAEPGISHQVAQASPGYLTPPTGVSITFSRPTGAASPTQQRAQTLSAVPPTQNSFSPRSHQAPNPNPSAFISRAQLFGAHVLMDSSASSSSELGTVSTASSSHEDDQNRHKQGMSGNRPGSIQNVFKVTHETFKGPPPAPRRSVATKQPRHSVSHATMTSELHPRDVGLESALGALARGSHQDTIAEHRAAGNPRGAPSQALPSTIGAPRGSTADSFNTNIEIDAALATHGKSKKRRPEADRSSTFASQASGPHTNQRKKARPSKSTKGKATALDTQILSTPEPMTRDEEEIIDNVVNRQRAAAGKAPRKTPIVNKHTRLTEQEHEDEEIDTLDLAGETPKSDMNQSLMAPPAQYQRPVSKSRHASSGYQGFTKQGLLNVGGVDELLASRAPVAPMQVPQATRGGKNASSIVDLELLGKNVILPQPGPPLGYFLTGINPYLETSISVPNPHLGAQNQPSNSLIGTRNAFHAPPDLQGPSVRQRPSASSRTRGTHQPHSGQRRPSQNLPTHSIRNRNTRTCGLQDTDFVRLPYATAQASNTGRRVVPHNAVRNVPGEDIFRIRRIAQRLAREWTAKMCGQRATNTNDPLEQELIEIFVTDQLGLAYEQAKHEAILRLFNIVKRLAAPAESRQQNITFPNVQAENAVVREILQEVLIDVPGLGYGTAHARATLIHMMLMNRYTGAEQVHNAATSFVGNPIIETSSNQEQAIFLQAHQNHQGVGLAHHQQQFQAPPLPGQSTTPAYGGSIAPELPVIPSEMPADQQLDEHRKWVQHFLGSGEGLYDGGSVLPEGPNDSQLPVPEEGFEDQFDDELDAIMASRSASDLAADEDMIPI